MKKLIGFALGSIWRWHPSKNRNDLIRYARQLDISGVEITFAGDEDLWAFRLGNRHERWLRELPYVSIHAPFDLFSIPNREDIRRRLHVISKLYDRLNAKNVVFHPVRSDTLDLLKSFRFKVSIENMMPKTDLDMEDLKRLFRAYPEYHFCLDVSHAYRWGSGEAERLVKCFGDRISQVHFSGTYRNKCHVSLTRVTKPFLKAIECIRSLQVPFIVEENFRQKDLASVEEEIRYIRQLIG